jgi:parallel beta-helix repeat protein
MTTIASLRPLGILLALTLLTVAASGASATTYVDAACGDNANTGAAPDCGAPDGPKLTIQAAIDVPGSDTVIVAPGTYLGFIDASAHHLVSSGGAEATIIHAAVPAGSGVVFKCNAGTPFCGPVVDGFTLEGFTVSNGGSGAGIRAANGSIIRDCIVTGSSVGIYSYGESRTFIEHSIVSNNDTGLSCPWSYSCEIKNSLISNNGIGVSQNGKLVNSTVVGNDIGLEAGFGGSFQVVNSIVWNSDPSGLGSFSFTNSVLQDGDQLCSSGVTCVDTTGADPLFVDESLGDYRLSSGSPAIDAGSNGPVDWSTDLDGNPRIVGAAPATVDIGAYEYVAPPTAAGTVLDLVIDKSGIDLLLSWNADCGLGEAYGIYRGELELGYASIAPDSCDVTTTEATLTMGLAPGEFFLVVPAWGGLEGSYGSATGGRTAATGACHPEGVADQCAP